MKNDKGFWGIVIVAGLFLTYLSTYFFPVLQGEAYQKSYEWSYYEPFKTVVESPPAQIYIKEGFKGVLVKIPLMEESMTMLGWLFDTVTFPLRTVYNYINCNILSCESPPTGVAPNDDTFGENVRRGAIVLGILSCSAALLGTLLISLGRSKS